MFAQHGFVNPQARVSFANIQANQNTPTFTLPRGIYSFAWRAADPNNPGTTTLYDNTLAANVFTSSQCDWTGPMAGARNLFIVPVDGEAYYVSVTQLVNNVVIEQVG